MLCYVFKVRFSKYLSKRDAKQKIGYNVALVALEGAKFHLETFIDNKDDIFANPGLKQNFAPGFWDIDIDEFEVYTPTGSQYVKKIISINGHKHLEDAKCYLDT